MYISKVNGKKFQAIGVFFEKVAAFREEKIFGLRDENGEEFWIAEYNLRNNYNTI